MKYIRCLILFIISLSIISEANSADICSQKNTVIYYGNGVGNGIATHGEATSSLLKLFSIVLTRLTPEQSELYNFKLAFNMSAQTDNEFLATLNDTYEAARQTLGNEWPTVLVAFILKDSRILDLLPTEIKQNFNDYLNNRAIQQLLAGTSSNNNVNDMVNSYVSDIGEGKKVVLLAHSQGNIFANLAYNDINFPSDKKQYFAIVPVASPESYCRNSLVGHVRFYDDLVIAGVQAAKALVPGMPSPLAANDLDNANSLWKITQGFGSHAFKESYLADDSARQFIVDGIFNSENLIPDPPSTAGQGTITVTLTWGSNPDVDLHTYEPTGRHVYYASRTGQFGYLDVDDVSGYGPEHYYASCQSLRDNPAAIGRYRFGVNYYYGYSPEVATITVKTPSSEYTTSKTLSSSRGSSGNNSMVPMADVVVSKNPDTGRFDFVIEPK